MNLSKKIEKIEISKKLLQDYEKIIEKLHIDLEIKHYPQDFAL